MREAVVLMGDSRWCEFDIFLLCFAHNLVPWCAFLVLCSPKMWYNKCVQIRGFN